MKATERGGVRGFDAHKHAKGRKRHILVDTSGLLIACRIASADISDLTSAIKLLGESSRRLTSRLASIGLSVERV